MNKEELKQVDLIIKRLQDFRVKASLACLDDHEKELYEVEMTACKLYDSLNTRPQDNSDWISDKIKELEELRCAEDLKKHLVNPQVRAMYQHQIEILRQIPLPQSNEITEAESKKYLL